MDKKSLVHLLFVTNNEVLETENVEDIFREKCSYIASVLPHRVNTSLSRIFSYLTVTTFFDCDDVTYEQQYLVLSFAILELLNMELLKSDILSVQDMNKVKTAVMNLMSEGVLKNLQPKLPHCIPRTKVLTTKDEVLYYYSLLKSTLLGFVNCLQNHEKMRPLILPHCLQGILVGVIQMAYGPLKKPDLTSGNVLVTEEMYETFVEDQSSFKVTLDKMVQNIHPSMFVKELMLLFHKEAPVWFKKALSLTLTKILRSTNGIQNVASAMFDDCDDDTTKTWQVVGVLTKVILKCKKLPNFEDNVCAQVFSLLESPNPLLYERLVVSCVKNLYCEDSVLCTKVFLDKILVPLKWFTDKDYKFEEIDYSAKVQQTVRLIHSLFVEGLECKLLPIEILKSHINVIFMLYHLSTKTSFEICNKQLREVFLKYLSKCERSTIQQIFDNVLFGFDIPEVGNFRNDIIVEIVGHICIKSSSQSIIYATSEVFNSAYNVLDTNQKIVLYGYLLKCLSEKEKYFFNLDANKSLLESDDFDGSTVFKRLLAIHQLLSQLFENAEVQKTLKESPDDVIGYIMTVMSSKADSQLMFTVVMIVDNLISNTSKAAFAKYKILLGPLENIAKHSTEPELKKLSENIVLKLNQEKVYTETKEDSDFDKALEDVCDPLLPTRGHGLLVLSKLLEKKDKRAMDRKQYLLNLFQLHLKDEDSFIYLNAVQGLAALADVFTDTILEVLCEEYSECKKDPDTRMKLGEVLVRVVKILGDMAPKYKALLLNTFLSATKDDDHLVRASSLSNLGEVCRVLNYKLGTIITEVLACVHSVIATDKAAEARRAAVTVLRQLFVGLQSEMLNFLKEEILPVYRTLKEIYHYDKDDVMKLQAQLALEELNENVKTIVFPNEQLHFEKKIIMLD